MNRSLANTLFDQLPRGYRVNRRLGPIYETSPSRADDLMLIHGLGAREANALNRLGIYFLAQIALWDNHELCAFADELGMTPTTLADERWVQQAQLLCLPRPVEYTSSVTHLPASFVRTVSLLACALLVGCLFVYWLSLQTNQPLRGVLSADITALRVPADARLVASHVRAGDEVFCGDRLLTLEKTEHLVLIHRQEERVRGLEQQLQQSEAQASLDLEWRTRELERELSDVRTRAHLIQQVRGNPSEAVRSAAISRQIRPTQNSGSVSSMLVSRSQPAPEIRQIETQPARPNSMLFITGQADAVNVTASANSPLAIPGVSGFVPVPPPQRPQPVPVSDMVPTPVTPAPQRIAMVLTSEGSDTAGLLSLEAKDVEIRLQRLEDLRQTLPEQVRRAAGVESVRAQYDEAVQRLDEMKALSRDVAVICPAHGKIGQIRYKVGDNMPSGESMLKLLHTDRRYVMVNVPTNRVNEIEPGTVMDLIFPGHELFRGKVANLPMLAESSLPNGMSMATVRVEPIGKLWPEIPVGSQIDAIIHKDTSTRQ